MDAIDRISQQICHWLGKRCARTWVVALPAADVCARLATVGHVSAPVPTIDPAGLVVADLKARRASLAPGDVLWAQNGIAGPVTCPAVMRGADLVVDDLETFLNLRSGLTAVSLSPDALRNHELADIASALARQAVPSAGQLAALQAAVEAYEPTQQRRCDNAQVLAEDLACHPSVALVRYPGLKGDPSHQTAARILEHGFGASLEFVPAEDAGTAAEVCARACGLVPGGARTVGTMCTVEAVPPVYQEARGLPSELVRVVCGDEDTLGIVMWAEALLGD